MPDCLHIAKTRMIENSAIASTCGDSGEKGTAERTSFSSQLRQRKRIMWRTLRGEEPTASKQSFPVFWLLRHDEVRTKIRPTVKVEIIENLSRTLELPLLVRSVVLAEGGRIFLIVFSLPNLWREILDVLVPLNYFGSYEHGILGIAWRS